MADARARNLLIAASIALATVALAVWANGHWVSGTVRNVLRLPGLAIPIGLALYGLGGIGIVIGIPIQLVLLTFIVYKFIMALEKAQDVGGA